MVNLLKRNDKSDKAKNATKKTRKKRLKTLRKLLKRVNGRYFINIFFILIQPGRAGPRGFITLFGQLYVQGQQLLGQLTCWQPPPPPWTASRPGSAAAWTAYLPTASTTTLDSFTSRVSRCLDRLPVDSLHHLLGQLHVQGQHLLRRLTCWQPPPPPWTASRPAPAAAPAGAAALA